MIRKIVVVLFLIMVLVSAVLAAPMVAAETQSGPTIHTVQGNAGSATVQAGALVMPNVLACAGCSGGGGGPG